MSDEERPTVVVPALCKDHQHDAIVHRLGITIDGPWQVTLAGIGLLMSQACFADDRIQKRTGGDLATMSLVLAEIGCPACYLPDMYRKACRVMRGGYVHGFDVAFGKATDAAWPTSLQPPQPNADV